MNDSVSYAGEWKVPVETSEHRSRRLPMSRSEGQRGPNGGLSFGREGPEYRMCPKDDGESIDRPRAVDEGELIAALEDFPSGVYFFDADLRVRWLNKEALRRIGRTELGDLIGRSWFEVHPEMEARRDIYDRVLAGESIELENARAILKEGDRFYDVRYQPLRDGRGMLGFSVDVTERYWAEQRLRAANRLESLGRLTGGIAHDLNNHLTAIFGYIELARFELGKAHPSFDHLSRVIEVGRSSQVLIEKLLDFARRRPMKPAVCGLSSLVEVIADRLLYPLLDEDLELRFDLEPDLGSVLVDPSAVEQILVNLVVNARDAMPHGGIVRIRTHAKTVTASERSRYPGLEPGPYLVIQVSDDGVGMDGATLESCFEPFFTTKDGGKNSGLGLSTCFGLVRQMSGTIDVESDPGHGSTFAILLPRVGPGEPEPEGRAKPHDSESLTGSETLLLVEDDVDVRMAVAASLVRFGYRVLEAANSGEALLIAEQDELPIHVLVTDVIMPRVSGPVLARRMMTSRPELRVVFMSGHSMHPSVESEIDSTVSPFIAKPFSGEDLAAAIRQALDRPATDLRPSGASETSDDRSDGAGRLERK